MVAGFEAARGYGKLVDAKLGCRRRVGDGAVDYADGGRREN
jgi:hypothetical protein